MEEGGDLAVGGQHMRSLTPGGRMGRHDGPPKKVPAPGLQPVAPEEEERAPQLGRVVSRFERSAEELDALSSQWQQVAEKKLSGAQKLRVKPFL